MKHSHALNFKNGPVTIVVDEQPDAIWFQIKVPNTIDPTEESKFKAWALPIFAKYDNDRRPTKMVNNDTGQLATCYGDANNAILYIEPPTRN